ncbi:hypothetical protein J6590_015935 [Homalodisca vitripennis]|nr:hypothetical protein J6590_015935 [Homalodisca vitripennis]
MQAEDEVMKCEISRVNVPTVHVRVRLAASPLTTTVTTAARPGSVGWRISAKERKIERCRGLDLIESRDRSLLAEFHEGRCIPTECTNNGAELGLKVVSVV